MDLGLRGKVALVTGATRGIGLAIAEGLAREGCTVALCARSADDVERTAARLGARVPTYGAAVDVEDDAALEAFVAEAARRLGGLDALVANAGGSLGGALLAEADGPAWRRTLGLNVVHAAVAARAAAPIMRDGGGGAIVVVASVSGLRPQPRAQYAAAKAAEIHLAASLGRELGPWGIRVNALSPGSILAPGGGWERRRDEDPEGFERWVRDEFPLGRLGSPEEVADAACFLLSPRAGWINGTNVVVDGGQNQPTISGF